MQRIVRKYYKQLYVNKLDNPNEMDEFLEIYNLPKLNQGESESLNIHITTNEIEAVNKETKQNTTTNKSPGQDGFTGEFYQTFQKELTLLFLQLFKNN